MRWRNKLALLLSASYPFLFGAPPGQAAEPVIRLTDDDTTPKGDLLFFDPAQRDRLIMFAGHRSHASHASHASHYSGSSGHASHSSHYSGSSPSYSPPAPLYTPPAPAKPKPVPKPVPQSAAPRSTRAAIMQRLTRSFARQKRSLSSGAAAPNSFYGGSDANSSSSAPAVDAPAVPGKLSGASKKFTNAELVEFVTRVQIALIVRGYNPGPVDGQLGDKTKAALAKFQTDNGLEVTGFMDVKTLELLGIIPATTTAL